MLVIPAIDIISNKAVRLTKGDFNSVKQYPDDPLQLVRQFHTAGFKRIHIVDLDASKTGSFTCLELLRKIKNEYEIEIQFGGGVRSEDDVKLLIKVGVDYIILGSVTVKNEIEFIFAADVLNNEIKIGGWTESTDITIDEYIEKWQKEKIKSFLCTDISKDGMLQGPSFNLYKELMNKYPGVDLIASGGVSQFNDLVKLKKLGLKYAVVGKAFYENKITLEELSQFA
jgi:phosphoribosylformimino-5-aminoimidazole carboxamide ribotide isomerase